MKLVYDRWFVLTLKMMIWSMIFMFFFGSLAFSRTLLVHNFDA